MPTPQGQAQPLCCCPRPEMPSAPEMTHQCTTTLHKCSQKCHLPACFIYILSYFSCSVTDATDWKYSTDPQVGLCHTRVFDVGLAIGSLAVLQDSLPARGEARGSAVSAGLGIQVFKPLLSYCLESGSWQPWLLCEIRSLDEMTDVIGHF